MNVCVSLVFICAVIHASRAQRNYVDSVQVGNGGPWGSWNFQEFCADGYFAVGYNMKIEERQGKGDDTAMNGIKLLCAPITGDVFGGQVTSSVGPWGTWRGDARCRNGYFLSAFTLQVEGRQGDGDDTAANFILFQCRNKITGDQYILNHPMGQGYWGTFGGWSKTCPSNSAICGITTKVEEPQGKGDDTSLNDVQFFCCDYES